ncbi:MAG: hypothetical protein J1E34_04910 [Oscillospiraceae bacterium]|nr:hypothetical protein [Oscillospiraceae bacterium]
MEDNNTYTYQRSEVEEMNEKNRKRERRNDPYNRRMIILFIAAVALLIVLGVVFGKYMGMLSAKKSEETSSSAPSEEITSSEPDTSEVQPSELYSEGEYLVNTEGSSLKFRKDHSLSGDVILEIKDGTKLTISEIFHDEDPGATVEYWGKTSYYGYDGWVAMSYLKNAFSSSIITPEEIPSSESSTGDQNPSSQNPSDPSGEPSSEAPSSGNASDPSSSSENTTAAPSSPYTPGDYTVATDGSTLSFRASASASAEILMGLADGTKITVTRIVDAGGNDETRRYWGEINYLGHTGYVSMYYLDKVS